MWTLKKSMKTGANVATIEGGAHPGVLNKNNVIFALFVYIVFYFNK